jgi:L-2-hydroxyglutarate oxidase LhgO
LSSRVGVQADKEIANPSKLTPSRNPARSNTAVAVSGSAHSASPSKQFADRAVTAEAASAVHSLKVSAIEEDSDGFKTVTYRKKTTTGASTEITVNIVGNFLFVCGILLPCQLF